MLVELDLTPLGWNDWQAPDELSTFTISILFVDSAGCRDVEEAAGGLPGVRMGEAAH